MDGPDDGQEVGDPVNISVYVTTLKTVARAMAGVLIGVVIPFINPSEQLLFAPHFPSGTQLITNEYAYHNPDHADAVISPDWIATSGSLFGRDGTGWTGPVDRDPPGPTFSMHTGSAVFRLITKRMDFTDVHVQFRLSLAGMSATRDTPAVDWDGVHIWLRYQSEFASYAVSVARRDGVVLIKKKCAGGPTNGGTYYTLTPQVKGFATPPSQWRYVGATAVNNPDGSVRVTMLINGKYVVGATDRGVGCAPLRSAGAIGIRGDNTEFSFSTFTVTKFPAKAATGPAPATRLNTAPDPPGVTG